MAEATLARLEEFTAQNICNVLWAFAKLDVLHESLLAAAVHYGLQHMASFAPQSVSNMTWAFATLGYHPGQQ